MTDETGEVWVLDANLLARSDTRQYQVITYTIMHISILPESGVGIRTLKNFSPFLSSTPTTMLDKSKKIEWPTQFTACILLQPLQH